MNTCTYNALEFYEVFSFLQTLALIGCVCDGSVLLQVWPDNRTAFPDFFRSSTKAWWKEEIRLLYAEKGLEFDGLWIVSVGVCVSGGG